MKEYVKGARLIVDRGFKQQSAREGMPPTLSYSNLQLRFKIKNGQVPILTTKHVSFKNVIAELLWFLKGEQNIKFLIDNDCHIWDDNAYKWFVKLNKDESLGFPNFTLKEFVAEIKNNGNHFMDSVKRPNNEIYVLGDNGRIYGWQWRDRKVDQLQRMIDNFIVNPSSRQNKVVAWIPEDMTYEYVSQPNCHGDFTLIGKEIPFIVRLELLKDKLKEDNISFNPDTIRTDLKKHNIPAQYVGIGLQQRSGDYALGIPYNIASYGVLDYIVALLTGSLTSSLTITCTDAHVYTPHIKTLMSQCKKEELPLPTLTIKGNLDAFLDDVTVDDFKLVDYQHQGKVKFKLFTGKATNNKSNKK